MPLPAEDLDKIKLVLVSQGWNDVMRPSYAQRARRALNTLANFKKDRTDAEFKDLTDEELRAIIHECEWMLTVWDNEIRVAEMNRRLEEAAEQQEANGATPR